MTVGQLITSARCRVDAVSCFAELFCRFCTVARTYPRRAPGALGEVGFEAHVGQSRWHVNTVRRQSHMYVVFVHDPYNSFVHVLDSVLVEGRYVVHLLDCVYVERR